MLIKKKLFALLICFTFVVSLVFTPVKAQANVLGDTLRIAAMIKVVQNYMDWYSENYRESIKQDYMRKTGVINDPEANAFVGNIMTRLQNTLRSRGELKYPYSYWVNPSRDFNAFCTFGHNISVNIGLLDDLDWNEDEVGFVLAHEITHGQRKHTTKHIGEMIGLSAITQAYMAKTQNELVRILEYGLANNICAKGITLPDEIPHAPDSGAPTRMKDRDCHALP